jgi:hypothetical protein
MTKLSMLGIISGAALLTGVPFSLQWSQNNVTLSLDSGCEGDFGKEVCCEAERRGTRTA